MIIICPVAGIGSRLHPITLKTHKNMIKIAGKHIIDYIMEKIQETFPSGMKICFIIGYNKDVFMQYMEQNYSKQFDLIFLEQKATDQNNGIPKYAGLGDAILTSSDIAKNEDCAILLCDRLPVNGYSSLLKKFQGGKRDGIFNITKTSTPQLYGVVQADSIGTIKKIAEKPKEFVSNLAVSGGYIIGKSITGKMFNLLSKQKKEPLKVGKEHHMGNILQNLIIDGANFGLNLIESPVLDFGNIKEFLTGSSWILEDYCSDISNKLKFVDQGNYVNVDIIPPVYIGNGVEIFNSILGPNVSIGENCDISNCELRNTVIGDGAKLQDIQISNSLVGNDVTNDNIEDNLLIYHNQSN